MRKHSIRWRMKYCASSLEKSGIDIIDFKTFLKSPKLVMDYSESLFYCNELSGAEVRISQRKFELLIEKNNEGSMPHNLYINSIRHPEIVNQYQQLGRGEKDLFTHALALMVYKLISGMTEKKRIDLLRGELDMDTEPTKSSDDNLHDVEETDSSVERPEELNNQNSEVSEKHASSIVESSEDTDTPKEGTDEHDRLFAGMGDMFKESGVVENEGFQHNLSGDEPDIDTM